MAAQEPAPKLAIKPLYHGTVGQIQDLLAKIVKGEVNKTTFGGVTPLMMQTMNNHYDQVKALLEAGADPTLQDDTEKTALDYAIQFEANPEKPIQKLLEEYKKGIAQANTKTAVQGGRRRQTRKKRSTKKVYRKRK